MRQVQFVPAGTVSGADEVYVRDEDWSRKWL